MSNGFFNSSLLESKTPTSLLPKCGACKLNLKCNSPKLNYIGKGGKKILIISESPSKKDDENGRLYSSPRPTMPLETALRKSGVRLERDCWLTTSLICYSGKEPTSDRVCFTLVRISDTFSEDKRMGLSDLFSNLCLSIKQVQRCQKRGSENPL